MTRGVEVLKGGIISTHLDWKKFVDEPKEKGYYIEAFASADALIDQELRFLLRAVYRSRDAEALIYELDLNKERTNFFGSTIAAVLNSIGVLDQELYDKINRFKKARNLVCHSTTSVCALVIANPYLLEEIGGKTHFKYSNTKELDALAKTIAKRFIGEALDIWSSISDLYNDVRKRPDRFYDGREWKKEHPLQKRRKKLYPKIRETP